MSHDTPPADNPDSEAHSSTSHPDNTAHSKSNPTSSGQDIRNAQWLVLSRDESILWWGQPSYIPHLPFMLVGVLTVVLGPILMYQFPDMVGNLGLLAIPAGIIVFVVEYLKVITKFYVVTDDKVIRKRGIIRRDTIELRYENVEHVNALQSVFERLLGFGDISLASAGTSYNEVYLDNVREPRTVAQEITQQKDNAYRNLRHE